MIWKAEKKGKPLLFLGQCKQRVGFGEWQIGSLWPPKKLLTKVVYVT